MTPQVYTQWALDRFVERHGDKYDYSALPETFDRNTEITIHCNTCDKSFQQRVRYHVIGRGCTTCMVKTKCASTNSLNSVRSHLSKIRKFQQYFKSRSAEFDLSKVNLNDANFSQPIPVECKRCNQSIPVLVTNLHRRNLECPHCSVLHLAKRHSNIDFSMVPTDLISPLRRVDLRCLKCNITFRKTLSFLGQCAHACPVCRDVK